MTWLIINSEFKKKKKKVERSNNPNVQESSKTKFCKVHYTLIFIGPFITTGRNYSTPCALYHRKDLDKELNHRSDAMALHDGPLDNFPSIESKIEMGETSFMLHTYEMMGTKILRRERE
jgi:hypothetical protein